MGSQIETKSLGEIINLRRGHDLPIANMQEGDIPVIGSNGIIGYHNEHTTKAPCLTVGRSGSVGKLFYSEVDSWAHNTSLYVDDFKGNNPKYVFYLLHTLNLGALHSGSVVPSLNRNYLHPLKIKCATDVNYQQKIAAVLSALDAKIELNARINAELESMAKTLYDYWFVQFAPHKSAGGKMVWNEKLGKEIPEGWQVDSLGKVTKTNLGGTPSTKNPEYWENATIPWLNSGDLTEFPIIKSSSFVTQKGVDNSATTILPKGSVVISLVRYIRPSIIALEACANQSVVGIRETKELKNSFIYPYLVNEVPRLMSLRTGAQQPHINKETIDDSPICIPPTNILNEYYKISEPIYKKIINVAFESQTLTELRDWLLPMLMNGQVKIV